MKRFSFCWLLFSAFPALAGCTADPDKAEHAHKNFDALIGNSVQTALDIFGMPDMETTKAGKMLYQWRAAKEGSLCFVRATVDKDGIIRHVHLKGGNLACDTFIDELDSSDIRQHEKPGQ